jgi:peptide/nickel transport system substrate-binding protein
MTRSAIRTLLPLAALLALALAACGGAAAGQEGTLRVAFQPLVQTDPALISSDSEVFVANAVFDYLVDIDPVSNEPVGRLAEGWEISEDGLSYMFVLKEGITFHDGSPLTAADVVYTFDRLRDADAGYATSTLYANIATVSANNDREVVFTLTQPNPFFLYDLSDNHALILKDGSDGTDFNGSGPFTVESYSPEDRIVLAANPNYFVDGEPRLDHVEVIFFSDDTAMVDALRGGQVDLVMRMSTPLFESLKDVDGIVTTDIPTNGFDLIRLRSDREPGSDPRVIQAMKLATDRQAILELVQQGYGAVGNDSPIGPLYTNYHDSDVTPPARDPEAARALLAEAGYPDGLDLTIHVPNTGGRPDLAAVLQQQWAEAGINLEISVEPEDVYYGDDGWLEVDLGITGWGSRPYPQFYLDTMLETGAVWNESHFSDAEFDELSATAGSSLDEAERVEAYAQIQQLLAERGPVIIPYYFPQFAAISDAFAGFQVEAFAGRTDLQTIYVK